MNVSVGEFGLNNHFAPLAICAQLERTWVLGLAANVLDRVLCSYLLPHETISILTGSEPRPSPECPNEMLRVLVANKIADFGNRVVGLP